MSEHIQNMYEDMMLRRREVRAQLEAGGGDADMLLRQLNSINKALGDAPEAHDPLFDKWERELEEGKIPDLDEMPMGA